MIIDGVFDFINEVVGNSNTLLVGAVGGRFAAKTVADGVDVLGGGFEVFVNGNANIGVFDLGVFETVV